MIKKINREELMKKKIENEGKVSLKPIEIDYSKNSNLKKQAKRIGAQYEIDESGLWILQDNGDKCLLANYMELIKIIKNIDTNTYKAIIRYKSFLEIKEIEVDRENYLNKNKLLELMNSGLDIRHSNVGTLVEYFREAEEAIDKVENVHSKIGFSRNNGKKIYKLYKAIGIDSKYIGRYEIMPKGTKEEYEKMLEEEVYGRCELEFIMIASLSAVVLGYIGEEIGLDNLIIHLVGNSTTGKSTALKFAISLFGYPDVKKQGIYSTYNGTNNALLNKVGGMNGVPFALDEISMSYTKNFTTFVYAMTNGTDKDRLNKNSELKEKETWLTTILSNGEKSLIESSNKNAGIQVRVIEARNFSWTKNAENSENINQTILKSYGHIGFEFAKYILNIDEEEVIRRFTEVRDELYKQLESKIVVDSMTKRRCSKYALLLLTAYYYEKMKDIKLDIDGIINMLIKIESESIESRSFSQSAIDYVKQYVAKYKRRFECGDNTPIDTLGKIITKGDCIEIQMNKISFAEMIRQGGYEDKNVVLKELRDNGFLNHEKDRFTRSRKNSLGYIEEVYVIKLPKEQMDNKIREDFENVVI